MLASALSREPERRGPLGYDASYDPVIRERQSGTDRAHRETPMTFTSEVTSSQASQAHQAHQAHHACEPDETSHDGSDSLRTARRVLLTEDGADEILRKIDGPAGPSDLTGSDDEDITGIAVAPSSHACSSPSPTIVPEEPATLESLPHAPDATGTLPVLPGAPDATGTLPALPPSPESTPTLDARAPTHAPSRVPAPPTAAPPTPLLLVAPGTLSTSGRSSTSPTSQPPSTLPTVIAPRSMGVPSRRHTDLFEDLGVKGARALPIAPIVQLDDEDLHADADLGEGSQHAASTQPAGQPVTWRSSGTEDQEPVTAPAPQPPSTTKNPETNPVPTVPNSPAQIHSSIPRTRPYPPAESPESPEPTTHPASLPIPLVKTAPSIFTDGSSSVSSATSRPSTPPSLPIPLARLIETTVAASPSARPTLESAQPMAMAAPPPAKVPTAPHSAVRPLVLADLSSPMPVVNAYDPRLAHLEAAAPPSAPWSRQVDRQAGPQPERQAEAQQAAHVAHVARAQSLAAPVASGAGRSRMMIAIFSCGALLIAATMFVAGVIILRSNQPTDTGRAQSFATQARMETPRALPGAPASPVSKSASPTNTSQVGKSEAGKSEDNGIPVLAVDALPRVHNTRGILHVGKQLDGHRVFVDNVVMGSGSGDYELFCGKHAVKIGSQDRARIVVVPCGGETTL